MNGGRRAAIWVLAAAGSAAAILICIAYLDQPLALWSATLDPRFRNICARITVLGEARWYLVPFGVVAAALFLASRNASTAAQAEHWRRLMWSAIFIFAAVALSGLLADLLKILFGRARPILLERDSYAGWQPFSLKAKFHAFPSGHADTVFALAAAVSLLAPRLSLPFILLAVIVAFTRIALNAHFLGDVIGGAALGVATTFWLRDCFARYGLLFASVRNGADGKRPSAAPF